MTTAAQVVNNFLYETTTSLTNIDFWERVMQYDNDATSIASGEATALWAGPPVFRPQGLNGIDFTKFLTPIGGVQNYNLNEGQQVIPFPELGSRIKRHVVGGGQYSASLGRVLVLHSDIGYSCYSWIPILLSGGSKTTDVELELALPPGVNGDRHFVTMESDIFGIPFGLLAVTGSANGDLIHCEYLERCYFASGGYARSAGQPMVVESVGITVTRPVAFVNSKGDNLFKFDMATRRKYTLAAPSLK